MNEQNFEKMDQEWMNATKEIREKKVSEGMLKGFSASVERRILATERPTRNAWTASSWVPAMAILLLASLVVLRLPSTFKPVAPVSQSVEYAQLHDSNGVSEEIAALKEVGAWNEADDALFGGGDETIAEDLELSKLEDQRTNIA